MTLTEKLLDWNAKWQIIQGTIVISHARQCNLNLKEPPFVYALG